MTTLSSLAKAFGKHPAAVEQFQLVISELGGIVNDQDLHLAHLGLKVAASIVHADANAANLLKDSLIGKIHDLLKSSFLQGPSRLLLMLCNPSHYLTIFFVSGMALESLLALYKELATANVKSLPVDGLLSSLITLGTADNSALSKQSFSSVSSSLTCQQKWF